MRRFKAGLALAVCVLPACALALERSPNDDYRARRERLAKEMKPGTFLIFQPTENAGGNALYGFVPDKDFYYLTGWAEPGAALLISSEGNTYREVFYLPERNRTQERWTGPKAGPEDDLASQYGFTAVHSIDRMRADLIQMLPAEGPQNVFTPMPEVSALDWLRRANAFSDALRVRAANTILGELRKVKDSSEIALIQKATDASVAAHRAALQAVDAGVRERAVAALMQYEAAKRGCERMAYAPIVGAGIRSTILHYSDLVGRAEPGDLMLMDVAGEYSFYASDITRTVPVNGKFSPRQREIYEIVLGAQQAAERALVVGKSTLSKTSANSIYKVALEYINTHGKDLHGQSLGRYFTHGLSHNIGLDVHDPGDVDKPIERGMVFSIEPGVYLPEEKIGVRIEDVYWVNNESKLVRLTAALPRTADEIERTMQSHGTGALTSRSADQKLKPND